MYRRGRARPEGRLHVKSQKLLELTNGQIQQAALKADRDPQSFCDDGAEMFQHLASRANITYDHFVRTTDKSHKESVEYAWVSLR